MIFGVHRGIAMVKCNRHKRRAVFLQWSTHAFSRCVGVHYSSNETIHHAVVFAQELVRFDRPIPYYAVYASHAIAYSERRWVQIVLEAGGILLAVKHLKRA